LLTVVTAIFGPGFNLHQPSAAWPGVRFVCFTDRTDLAPGAWEIVQQNHPTTPRRSNRCVKATLHRYIDGTTLYLDSDFQVTGDPRDIVGASLEGHCWSATKHPQRHCLFDEAEFCIKKKRLEGQKALSAQLRRYRAKGMPHRFGLWAGGILARRGDADSRRLGELWWSEIKRGSERDQISLPFVAWGLGLQPGEIPGVYTALPGLARKKRPKV
jgi:hypothetical protein